METRHKVKRRQKSFEAFNAIMGVYLQIKYSSSKLKAEDYKPKPMGGCYHNPAKPSAVDFCCDVENIIKYVVEKYHGFNKQMVGGLFISKGIFPISKYFFTLRRKAV